MVGDGGVLTDLDMYYTPILDSEKIFCYILMTTYHIAGFSSLYNEGGAETLPFLLEKIFSYFHDPIAPNNRGMRNDFFATPSRNSRSALVDFTTIRTLGFGGICNIGVLT